MTEKLEIVQIPAGRMDNFSYLVYCPATNVAAAVDPSFAPENLLSASERLGVQIEILFNTHGHNDHTAGNGLILEKTGARLAAHPLDLPGADRPLTDGLTVEVGGGTLRIIHTPGHTPGSVCLYTGEGLITGDTLFVTRVGRADLAGSDPAALFNSLRRLAELPGDTRVFPGHDYGPSPTSTIAFELANNPFLRCADLDSFIRLRMG